MGLLLKILAVIALSSVKFIGGAPLAYIYRFGYWETIALTTIGGMLGVILVMYISPWVIQAWNFFVRLFEKKDSNFYAKPTSDMDGDVHFKYTYIPKELPRKQVFTSKSRRVVSIWLKYGVFGIAFVTPILLSIPAGTFIICRLERSKIRIIIGMIFSILFWSIVITSIRFQVGPKPL